jgi:hypothetical protein
MQLVVALRTQMLSKGLELQRWEGCRHRRYEALALSDACPARFLASPLRLSWPESSCARPKAFGKDYLLATWLPTKAASSTLSAQTTFSTDGSVKHAITTGRLEFAWLRAPGEIQNMLLCFQQKRLTLQ